MHQTVDRVWERRDQVLVDRQHSQVCQTLGQQLGYLLYAVRREGENLYEPHVQYDFRYKFEAIVAERELFEQRQA